MSVKEIDAWYETVDRVAKAKVCPKCKSTNIQKTYRNEPPLNCAFVTYCGDCQYEIIAILD